MTDIAGLLARVRGCGYEVRPGPRLVPVAPGAACPPGLLAELRARRDEVAAAVGWPDPVTCPVCSAAVFDPGAAGALCDRGGCRPPVNPRTGAVGAASPRCPYKPAEGRG